MFVRKPESLSPDKRYSELGNNYRYFLTWRQALYAGYFVVIGFVLINTFNIFLSNPKVGCFIPLIGPFVSGFFLIIDLRIRSLYHAAIQSGKELEGGKGGFYTSVSKESTSITHSGAIDFTYIGTGIFLLFLFIGLIIFAFCYSG